MTLFSPSVISKLSPISFVFSQIFYFTIFLINGTDSYSFLFSLLQRLHSPTSTEETFLFILCLFIIFSIIFLFRKNLIHYFPEQVPLFGLPSLAILIINSTNNDKTNRKRKRPNSPIVGEKSKSLHLFPPLQLRNALLQHTFCVMKCLMLILSFLSSFVGCKD